jgi:hypothetical protein
MSNARWWKLYQERARFIAPDKRPAVKCQQCGRTIAFEVLGHCQGRLLRSTAIELLGPWKWVQALRAFTYYPHRQFVTGDDGQPRERVASDDPNTPNVPPPLFWLDIPTRLRCHKCKTVNTLTEERMSWRQFMYDTELASIEAERFDEEQRRIMEEYLGVVK